MLAWEIPQEDWPKLTIKTGRWKPGTQELQLLWSALTSEWFLSEVARRYGPGTYKILAGPGPYQKKNTTIHVSAEYAREAGWEPAPAMIAQPDPAQLMAGRTAQEALAKGIDPVNLAQMLATAADSAVEKALAKLQQQQPPQQTSDPSMLLIKGFEMALLMTGKATEMARGMTAPVAEDTGWVGLIKELGPSLLDTVKIAMTARPASPQAPATQPQPRPALQTAVPQPMSAPMSESQPHLLEPPPETVPLLRLMADNRNVLLASIASQQTAESLAEQLAQLIGPAMDESVLATADHVATHGPAILGSVDPALVSTKAAAVLEAWANIIRSESGGTGSEEVDQ